ncbi:hypothetical protein TEA_002444 [Camellia sinensis var. sinensis]|uniref:E2F/DP family winged-helix DNA-binding domain-containing protein n=1 Tax=Camellia sinensis var. sinensis TaxID=542762 RepID=A0A4V3WK87_CAMSN|nr:hypothetical protein TEA_002444 [Camellia sinensis var. sinensis]
MIKTGKHAEIWPEKVAGKEKNSGKSENGKGPNGSENSFVEKTENPTQNAKNSGGGDGGGPAGEKSPAKENNGAVERSGGGHGGKKKKKKGHKGNNGSGGSSLSGALASTGSQNQNVGPAQVMDQINLGLTRQHPDPYPPTFVPDPAYVVSYNAAHPGKSGGPNYYIPSSPYTYAYVQPQVYAVHATPLDSFQIFSDENPNNRKEKSLGLLTQNFVKLFLCSNVDLISLEEAAKILLDDPSMMRNPSSRDKEACLQMVDLISLEEAAKILLGDAHDPSMMRTKVRRLYDIANVLSSMNFIEKTHHPETRKPAFRWLGTI